MVSNESETDSYPRKRQGKLLSFLTNPIVKKSKADTKDKKKLMTEMARLVTVLLQNHVNLMRNF